MQNGFLVKLASPNVKHTRNIVLKTDPSWELVLLILHSHLLPKIDYFQLGQYPKLILCPG